MRGERAYEVTTRRDRGAMVESDMRLSLLLPQQPLKFSGPAAATHRPTPVIDHLFAAAARASVRLLRVAKNVAHQFTQVIDARRGPAMTGDNFRIDVGRRDSQAVDIDQVAVLVVEEIHLTAPPRGDHSTLAR